MRTFIELEQALECLSEALPPPGEVLCPWEQALGRTLARDLTAPIDGPPFDRSPLDGYALRAEDTTGAASARPVRLRVRETVWAGQVPKGPLRPGEAVRIMTGAMLPQGCDCVLRQEDTDQGFPVVSICRELHAHENYIDRGEDYRAGTVLLPAGTRLDAAALGLLAGAGYRAPLPLRQRPRVWVISTGDELTEPGTHPLPPGKIYDANLTLLTARLRELGITETGGERLPDEPSAAAERIRKRLAENDLLITTGGVSVGEKDIFHQVLPLLNAEQIFWRVNLKPGSPAMFSRCGGKPILSLSGNPFAAAATFELLARPLLAGLSGEPHFLPRRTQAVLSTPFAKSSPGRRFVRGRCAEGAVSLPAGHASGILSSLTGCNCMVDIPAGSGPLEPGQRAAVWLL